jgi:hypothetical protein
MGFGDGFESKSIPWVDPLPGTASMLISNPPSNDWVPASIVEQAITASVYVIETIVTDGNISGNGAPENPVVLNSNILLNSVTASFTGSFTGDGSQLTNISAFPKLGNTIIVDSVNGNDSSGSLNGVAFKTVNAAINYISSSSLAGVTVWIAPATYTLTSGFTIPSGCSLRGLSTQTTKLVLTGSNPGGTVTMLTMGENTRVEDLSLQFVSTNTTTNLVGILLSGTAGTTSKLRTAVLTVDNSSITASANTSVYGIYSSGSAGIAPSDFSFNFTRGVTVNVFSNGGGNKRGVYGGSSDVVTFRDTNIYVKAPTSALSTGSYVGIESTNASSSLQFRTTSISGPTTSGSYTGSDILQTTPGSGFINTGIQLGPGCDLINKTAGGKPFTTYVTPTTLTYSLNRNIPNGHHYLWQGVQTSADTTEVYYRFQQKSILQGMSANMRVAAGGANGFTITILKSTTGLVGSGVATAMSASITGDSKSTTNYVCSVDFGIGEYLGVKLSSTNPGLAADLTVQLDVF